VPGTRSAGARPVAVGSQRSAPVSAELRDKLFVAVKKYSGANRQLAAVVKRVLALLYASADGAGAKVKQSTSARILNRIAPSSPIASDGGAQSSSSASLPATAASSAGAGGAAAGSGAASVAASDESDIQPMRDALTQALTLMERSDKRLQTFLRAVSATRTPENVKKVFGNAAAASQDTAFMVSALKSVALHSVLASMLRAVMSALHTLRDSMKAVAAVCNEDRCGAWLNGGNEARPPVEQLLFAAATVHKALQGLMSRSGVRLVSGCGRAELLAVAKLFVGAVDMLADAVSCAPPKPELLERAKIAASVSSQFRTALKGRSTSHESVAALLRQFGADARAQFHALMASVKEAAAAPNASAAAAARAPIAAHIEGIGLTVATALAHIETLAALDISSLVPASSSLLARVPLPSDAQTEAARAVVAKHCELVRDALAVQREQREKQERRQRLAESSSSSSSTTTTTTRRPVDRRNAASNWPRLANIWDEIESGRVDNLVVAAADDDDAKCVVRSGTLNMLVERLTSPTQPDITYMKTFITTYRSFTTPEVLLQKLVERFHVPTPSVGGGGGGASSQAEVIKLRVCNVAKNWAESSFDDLDEALVAELSEFASVMALSPTCAKFARSIEQLIDAKRRQRAARDSRRRVVALHLDPKIPLSPSRILFVFDEAEIARQLTLIEFELYASIKPVELLNQAWNKVELRHRAPNVLKVIARSTLMSMWIASCIVWQPTVKERLRLIAKIAKIVEHLMALNNFNALTAILAGLDNAAVYRMKHTRDSVPRDQQALFQSVRDLMSHDSSYALYRQRLHNVDPPCVPFIGVFLTDLTFIEEGNADNTKQGLINFAKRGRIYKAIEEIQQYQQISYASLKLVDHIAWFFAELPANNDEELYAISLELEPRGADRSAIQ
jgi:RasGEF domain/RasGEF N-terminal motif